MSTIHKLLAESDGCTFDVNVKSNGSVTIKSKVGYTLPAGSTLMKLEDNGNGYYAKTHSYSSVYPEHRFNLDYSEIEYIYYAYKALLESNEVDK